MADCEPLRVAIIGAGIGREHLSAYAQLPQDFSVVALCDRDEARAREVLAQATSPAEIISDIDAVLAREDIDIVDICLPPGLHFPVSQQVLQAGKHVICEKPITTSLKDVDTLQFAAISANRHVFPVFQYRYGPELQKLRALIAAGMTGHPLVATIETHWNRLPDYYANPWRGTWKGEFGGAVLGHAIHNHDVLTEVFGPVRRLNAFLATRVNRIETEDCASISFEMENGALATSSVTLGSATDETRFRFCFENITVESDRIPYAPGGGEWRFEARANDLTQEVLNRFLDTVAPQPVGFVGCFSEIAKRLRGQGGNVVSLEDGRRSIELVTAIYTSARQQMPVHLPLPADAEYYTGFAPKNL